MKVISLKEPNAPLPACFELIEEQPQIPAQQVTVPHSSHLNPKWARGIQISNEYLFVKRYGCPTVALHVDDIIALALAADPGLSWPPIFKKQPLPLVGTEQPMAVEVISELPVSLQWQFSVDGMVWVDLQGANAPTLPPTHAGFYRCAATNAAGRTESVGAQVADLNPDKNTP